MHITKLFFFQLQDFLIFFQHSLIYFTPLSSHLSSMSLSLSLPMYFGVILFATIFFLWSFSLFSFLPLWVFRCVCFVICLPTHWLLEGLVFANGPVNHGSIPGEVIPKTQKMVLDTSLINIQQYKICIKGKVEQSREKSCTFS